MHQRQIGRDSHQVAQALGEQLRLQVAATAVIGMRQGTPVVILGLLAVLQRDAAIAGRDQGLQALARDIRKGLGGTPLPPQLRRIQTDQTHIASIDQTQGGLSYERRFGTSTIQLAAYAGQPVEINNWADAAAYVRKLNEIALPHCSDADWDAFARRTFRMGTEGTPIPDYDPDIMVPIRAAGAKALVPNLWPFFTRLAKGRPVLLVRGETSDLLSPEIAAKMRKRAPKMDFVEVPGVGHAPMLDEPEAKAAIFPFLSELP